MAEYWINTGVKYGVNPYLDKNAKAVEAVGGGLVMVFPFECDEVPNGYKCLMRCANPNLNECNSVNLKDKDFLVREIHNQDKKEYAYFIKRN